MSESFTWRPLDNFHEIPTAAPNYFRETVEELFGPLPYTFTHEDRRVLTALAKIDRTNAGAWTEILSALERSSRDVVVEGGS